MGVPHISDPIVEADAGRWFRVGVWGGRNDTFFKESQRWYKDVKAAASAGRPMDGPYVVFHNMPPDHWKS